MRTGKSVGLELLVRQEDREYQYFYGVQICVCAILFKIKEIGKSILCAQTRASSLAGGMPVW